ncbi:hypothetical protein I2I11_02590 [Pontibacter sp. 172403-2]|nr:hypothetical protein [Pontibacter sp. 172403-2]MBF9252172.1 hypothetical protein [Pontibacter sp. 172403-2]
MKKHLTVIGLISFLFCALLQCRSIPALFPWPDEDDDATVINLFRQGN